MLFPRPTCLGAIIPALLAATAALRADSPRLEIAPGPAPDTITFSGTGSASGSHRIEQSRGLDAWWPVHAVRQTPAWTWDWNDLRASPASLFRLVDAPPPAITTHSSWKNQITLPSDPFLSEPVAGTGEPFDPVEIRWVKFAMITDGLPEVYFQDSSAYPFHFPFATERLAPFAGMDLATFNGVSLHRTGQQAVLGAVLWAPGRNELGIQFAGQDAYPPEMIRFLYDTVEARITKPAGCVGYYMPTYEQSAAAGRDRTYLAGHGIEVGSPERWIGGNVCYAEGWALGRLVLFAPDEIETAYASGDLLPTDILLTSGVPAEVPFVAGIITLAPTTPNSHVAILAQSYGVPFVYLRNPDAQARVLDMTGSDVVVRTRGYSCTIDVFDVDGLDPAYRSEITALKDPLPVTITPTADYGAIAMPGLAAAVPADIRFIGGKAANFGFLRRGIPANSPDAMAFTFDLWDAYLDQAVTGGHSLRTEIANRLAGLAWPADIPSLDATLRGIRGLIENDTDFPASRKPAIIAALSGFDPDRRIRFRSSTNVEDSGVFAGAGLYDSFSGCLADDTDADDLGPSHCDPNEPKERGVFRAMRKVYASFYNLNAVVERLRHGIDGSEVGMAILAHHSFPDEIEDANGVATSRVSGPDYLYTDMVSQVGAESVTNPTGGSLPEIVELFGYRNWKNPSLTHRQRSSRLLLGIDTVMAWEQDYQNFGNMFFTLADAYKAHFPTIGGFTLEFEYKKLTDGSLVIKQLREVPKAEGRPAPGVALVNRPTSLKVFQGERGTLFGNHRLKSLWQIESHSRWIDPAAPASTLITAADLTHAPQGAVVTRTGRPAAWPAAAYDTLSLSGNTYARDRWQWQSDGGNTTHELRIQMPAGTGYQSDPVYTTGDFPRIEFWANYQTALPSIAWPDNAPVSSEFALLVPGSPDDPLPVGAILKNRVFTSKSGAGVSTSFYWPPHPTGPTAGYTAPLVQWVGTTITGLTSTPVSLSGYFSQTYRPGHHNFTEEFLFEPGLDPAVPAATRTELQARNIRMIVFEFSDGFNDTIKAIGFDGAIRDL